MTADPLATLASDYERAVIHVSWDWNRDTRERTLLFAWVELLPTEIPPPIDDGEIDERVGSKSSHVVNVRHAVVSADRAIQWYRDCLRGSAVLPEEDGCLPEEDSPRARRIQVEDLSEEPPWPHLVCVEEQGTLIPFCPVWHFCPRVHHLVPRANLDWIRLWPKESERERAVRFLHARLHFELAEYPEYWGSIHLVAPNPVFRHIEVRRQPTSTEKRESILFRFHPRAGKDLQGLSLAVQDDRPSGLGSLSYMTVSQPLVRLAFEHATDRHSTTVHDRERGVLFLSHNNIFASGFNIGVSVGPARTRIVHVPGAKTYEVPLRMPPSRQVSIKHDGQLPSGRARMGSVADRRRKRTLADGQRWFNGVQEDAETVLREILHAAQREVLIIDPYFGAAELHSFALAVGALQVPIYVLTSAEFLGGKRDGHRSQRL